MKPFPWRSCIACRDRMYRRTQLHAHVHFKVLEWHDRIDDEMWEEFRTRAGSLRDEQEDNK